MMIKVVINKIYWHIGTGNTGNIYQYMQHYVDYLNMNKFFNCNVHRYIHDEFHVPKGKNHNVNSV